MFGVVCGVVCALSRLTKIMGALGVPVLARVARRAVLAQMRTPDAVALAVADAAAAAVIGELSDGADNEIAHGVTDWPA